MEYPGYDMLNPILARERKNLGSRVALLPGKCLRSGNFFKEKNIKFAIKKSFQKKRLQSNILNISGQSGIFPDSQENSRKVWKISGQYGRFPDIVEDFRPVREMLWTVWKITGYSGKFRDSMEDFQTVLTISGQSGEFGQSGKCY